MIKELTLKDLIKENEEEHLRSLDKLGTWDYFDMRFKQAMALKHCYQRAVERLQLNIIHKARKILYGSDPSSYKKEFISLMEECMYSIDFIKQDEYQSFIDYRHIAHPYGTSDAIGDSIHYSYQLIRYHKKIHYIIDNLNKWVNKSLDIKDYKKITYEFLEYFDTLPY